MNKIILVTRIRDFFFSSQAIKTVGFLIFTILMTSIIASQNFFFQTIVENGISKKDVVAQKTITVVDVKRTEQHKKEVAQKVDPILAPAEDDFIKTNLETLENSIIQIRRKSVSDDVKLEELSLLFDISSETKKNFVINFFLNSDDHALREVFDKANLTLTNVLQKGISEKDFETVSMDDIIKADFKCFKTSDFNYKCFIKPNYCSKSSDR